MVRFDLLDEYGCLVFHRRPLAPEANGMTAPLPMMAPESGSGASTEEQAVARTAP
jgi:hypothetical protein